MAERHYKRDKVRGISFKKKKKGYYDQARDFGP